MKTYSVEEIWALKGFDVAAALATNGNARKRSEGARMAFRRREKKVGPYRRPLAALWTWSGKESRRAPSAIFKKKL